MKFLLDMGIAPRCVAFLEAKGHEALHLSEEGWHRWSDAEILEFAKQELAIVLTHDLDFPQLLATSNAELPTVVVFRLSDMTSSNVCRYLELLLDQAREQLESGAVISVADERFRWRPLPIEMNLKGRDAGETEG
ncbi:MAG: DUF5615 family PIN-like protein [Acidobacteriota bacterium]